MAKVKGFKQICKAEHCERIELHEAHELPAPGPGKPVRPTSQPPWRHDAPKALTGAVARATSKAYPVHFAEIVREVRDDYGTCADRTVYRYLAKLVARGHVVKVDVGLTCAAYVRPKSRLLEAPDAIREYMLGKLEVSPTTKHARQAPAW
jgi:hypothetical protein